MSIGRVEYLRWAKALPRRRYALTSSGVPPVGPDVLDPASVEIRLDMHDTYGLPALIDAIAGRYGVAGNRVLPLPGTSMANFVAVGSVLRRGTRVLIEHPVYEPLVRVAEFLELEVVPVRRDPQRGFRPDIDALEAGLRAGAGAFLMTDLHNPSGMLCQDEDLREMVRRTGEHGAYLIVDEVYRDYGSIHRRVPPATAAALVDHVIVTSSLTKVYGLGALRAGWMIAAPSVIERARDLLDHLCVINPLPSQQLAVAAFDRIEALAERTHRMHREGHAVYREWLGTRDDLIGHRNDGAVFDFPQVVGLADTRPMCQLLADEYDTSVVPGAFFGSPQHVRISFAVPPDVLAEGLERVGRALDRVHKEC